jgi:glutamate racemase
MDKNPNVLVIDSGIGGLTVTQHIRCRCPQVEISYIADRAYFPYGQKTEDEINQRIHRLVNYGIQQITPDLIVVACNTASTIALDLLRQNFTVPFVGVVPAIKPAAMQTESGVIGVLATQATVNRPYTQNLIQSFANNNRVFLFGSSVLVEIAEDKLLGLEPDLNQIYEDVKHLTSQHTQMDTIVLACTHFPLLRSELQKLFPDIKYWIDSGEAISKRVAHLLKIGESAPEYNQLNNQLFVTGTGSSGYLSNLITPLLGSYTESNWII